MADLTIFRVYIRDGQVFVDVQHYYPDGRPWFQNDISRMGREGGLHPATQNGNGRWILDDDTLATVVDAVAFRDLPEESRRNIDNAIIETIEDAEGNVVSRAYLPEGRSLKRDTSRLRVDPVWVFLRTAAWQREQGFVHNWPEGMDRRLNPDVRITHTQEDLDFASVVEGLATALVGKSYNVAQGMAVEVDKR